MWRGQGRDGFPLVWPAQPHLRLCWPLAVSLLGSKTLWRRKMGTDQNQGGVKPRVWLAMGRSAQCGADWHSPGETGGPVGQGRPLAHLSGPVRGALREGPSWGVALCGAPCPARAPPAASARAPSTWSANCLQTTSDCVL